MGTLLIPFHGPIESGRNNVNLLWNDGVCFVMDNHRMAPWCWLQKIDRASCYDLVHIDQHHDCANVLTCEGARFLSSEPEMSLDRYLDQRVEHGIESYPWIGWDNFIPAFCTAFPASLGTVCFALHERLPEARLYRKGAEALRTLPWRPQNLREWDLFDVLKEIRAMLRSPAGTAVIIDLDLDFFFCHDGDGELRCLSLEYMRRLAKAIHEGFSSQRVAVLTIALSPECCGSGVDGWRNAYDTCRVVFDTLQLDFDLPALPR